ncbi:MAG: citrate lyase acyl carrier protein [Clostridia bacterium]|nr:citrate lyase acyl carrier protein [Clostridia bacterium]
MRIIKSSIAGTLESSDIQIRIEPGQKGKINIRLQSVVEKQFGNQIRELIREELTKLGVSQCEVTAIDKGALDFAIVARLQSAAYLGAGIDKNIAWEGM